MKSSLKCLTLNPKEDRRLLRGHLWAYRNEFKSIPDGVADGEAVDVFSDGRRFVGRGFYQAQGGHCRASGHPAPGRDGRRILPGAVCGGAGIAGAALSRLRRLPLGSTGKATGCRASWWTATARWPWRARRRCSTTPVPGTSPRPAWPTAGPPGWCSNTATPQKSFGAVPETVDLDVDGVNAELNLAETQKTGLFPGSAPKLADSPRVFGRRARV